MNMKWKVWNTSKPNVVYYVEADDLDTAIKVGREIDLDICAVQPEEDWR